jgi:8-oxo-dGTP diphosphatase
MDEKRPKVGVGVIIIRDGKVLLGRRKGTHATGAYAFPGGHLEFGESWESCAKREVEEETGMQVSHSKFVAVTNDIFEKEGKHYITIFMRSECVGEPKVMEPTKCDGWDWYEWGKLPQPLMVTITDLIKQGYKP